MFSDLNVFKLAHAMSAHAAKRQAVIARNVANADTPGFRARDIAPFSEFVSGPGETGMQASRLTHLNGSPGAGFNWTELTAADAPDPNGNSVSVEQQMLKAAEVRSEHNRALAIYRSNLNILRASLGRG